MRRDLVVDGIAFGRATVGGDDATCSLISMYESLERNDVNCILLGGLVISMYNIINGLQIAEESGLPVIAITFDDSPGLEGAIRRHFPLNWQEKMVQYHRIGKRELMTLKTGKQLYIRSWGITQRQSLAVLNAFTQQGALPEPVRVAKLAARSAFSLYQKKERTLF